MTRAVVEDPRDAVELAARAAFAHIPPNRMLALIPPVRREMAAVWLGSDTVELLRMAHELERDAISDEGRTAFHHFADTVRQLVEAVQA